MKVLIVKTSSLGDVIQSLIVLNYLKQNFPNCQIDWIVRSDLQSLLQSHPLIDRVIVFSFTSLIKLRKKTYDLVFDLQGNTKSATITLFSKSRTKVGFGRKSVREWPNLLVTNKKYNLSKNQNISDFYLGLLQAYFQDDTPFFSKGFLLNISAEEKKDLFLKIDQKRYNIMVCPSSKWENKKLSLDTLIEFLRKIQNRYFCHFFLSSGSFLEKKTNEIIKEKIGSNIDNLDRMPLTVWQNFMSMMDLVIAVDSSSLYLCATTDVATFSVFGPTKGSVFNPKGEKHHYIQGECPYKMSFIKQCPKLRSCKTGACIKQLDAELIFNSFAKWACEQNILTEDQN